MMSVGLHCRLAGRPGKLAGLERFLKHALGHQDVWFCRRIEIARHWRATHPMPPDMFDDLRRHYVNLAQPRLGAEVVLCDRRFLRRQGAADRPRRAGLHPRQI